MVVGYGVSHDPVLRDPILRDACETARLVRSGQLSPVETVNEAIARAEAVNSTINAIVEPAYQPACDQAARDQDASDRLTGRLAGVPLLLKDLFCPVAGDTAYQGNRLLRQLGYRYPETGAVARRLAAAGSLNLGRSHSPELGSGNSPAAAETDLYGPSRNPWDLRRSPLGSSGGAAAAVAAGVVPLAHASDGGGSIRIPASACGLVGLKPSRGRISAAPAGELWAGGVTDGVVSRTVADTALALDVLAGPEPGDPYRAELAPGEGWLAEVGRDPGSLRIGLCTALPYATTNPLCVEAAQAAAQLLESLGHNVEVSHPEVLDHLDYMYDYIRVIRVSLAAAMRSLGDTIGRAFTADDVEPGTWINFQRGLKVSAADYVASRERLHRFTRHTIDWWEDGHDLLLTPTLGTPPPSVGWLVDGDERELTARLSAVTPFMPQFNVTGQPAISVPLHWTEASLPIGVQLVAAPGREDMLLRIAGQLEAAAPWASRYAALASALPER